MVRLIRALITMAVLGASMSSGAYANESACAVIARTADGFVAMRAGPSANSAMIGRFSPGQVLFVVTSAGWPGWARVDYILKTEGGQLVSTEVAQGYVNEHLVRVTLCENVESPWLSGRSVRGRLAGKIRRPTA
jgi:hypothetical protein